MTPVPQQVYEAIIVLPRNCRRMASAFDNTLAATATGHFYADGVNITDLVRSNLIRLLERTGRICVVAECVSGDGPDAPQIGTWTMWNLSTELQQLLITKPEYATGLLEADGDTSVNEQYRDAASHLESLQGTYHLNDDGSEDFVEHKLKSLVGIKGLRHCSKMTIYVIGHSINVDPRFYVNKEEGVEIANVFAKSVDPDFRPSHIKHLSGTVDGEHGDVYIIEYDQEGGAETTTAGFMKSTFRSNCTTIPNDLTTQAAFF